MARRVRTHSIRKRKTTRTSRFGDTTSNPSAPKLKRRDTPKLLTETGGGQPVILTRKNHLKPSDAARLGLIEAGYANDLAHYSRTTEDETALRDLKETYADIADSVSTPQNVARAYYDLEDMAKDDLFDVKEEKERRAAAAAAAAAQAARENTLSYRVKAAFNKLFGGRNNAAFGKKKKYTKKARHGFSAYHHTQAYF